ncbi:MAG TPA: hypothetical protein VGE27_05985 [Gemmatimonas sp.]|uniref:hypothetical protein n=1 Tax=Gemmatimonas sp. TaxID=1962908 RepID=UPI002ED8AB43
MQLDSLSTKRFTQWVIQAPEQVFYAAVSTFTLWIVVKVGMWVFRKINANIRRRLAEMSQSYHASYRKDLWERADETRTLIRSSYGLRLILREETQAFRTLLLYLIFANVVMMPWTVALGGSSIIAPIPVVIANVAVLIVKGTLYYNYGYVIARVYKKLKYRRRFAKRYNLPLEPDSVTTS